MWSISVCGEFPPPDCRLFARSAVWLSLEGLLIRVVLGFSSLQERWIKVLEHDVLNKVPLCFACIKVDHELWLGDWKGRQPLLCEVGIVSLWVS